MSDTQSQKPSDVQWYIQVADGKKAGPTTFERLQQFVKVGRILPETKVREKQPNSSWVPAHTIPGLFDGENTETEAQQIELTEESIPVTEDPIEETPAESKKIEKTGSSVFTINVDGSKSNTAVTTKAAFKIDPKKSESKEEKTGKKASDKSSVSIKIAIDTPKDKNKVEKKSSEKSSSMFMISTKPVQKENSSLASTETIESAVISNEKKIVLLSKKKAEMISLLLTATAIFSVLVGLGGGLMLTMLDFKTSAFSVTIGIVVLLFGIVLGLVSWSLTLLFNQIDR